MGLRGVGSRPKLFVRKIRLVPGHPELATWVEPKPQKEPKPPKEPKLPKRLKYEKPEIISEPMPWEADGLDRADRVIAFCENLRVTSGSEAGTQLRLREWQKEFIREVYRVNGRTKRRVVRTAIFSMGRKNGKTQLAAALALCHLSGPEAENRGEVYACANDRFQASKIFHEMVAMINENPWLDARTNIVRFQKNIEDVINGSIYCTLTSEAKTKMGLSPSFVIYDELGQGKDRDLYDAMDSAMGARHEPLMMVISTQAADSYAPLSHLIDYGMKIKSGEIKDDSFHLTFYSAPDDADPWAEETWRLANPALGDFRSLEDVQRLAAQAQRMPTQENAFRNLILNQRVAAESRFMEPSAWKACGGKVKIPEGEQVWAGLDLGSTRDLTALVLAWKDPDDCWQVKPIVWVPGNLKEKGDEDGVPYEVWAREGVVIPSGVATDPRAVARMIAYQNTVNPFLGLAFDRWRLAEVKRELDQVGCHVPLVEHGQGYRDMTPAVDVVERLVISKKLKHGNNPVLTWCANNAVIIRDTGGGRKFDKSNTKYRSRIDALVAMAMALSAGASKDRVVPIDIETLIA
jgi:phage terminase large subunit-like protein